MTDQTLYYITAYTDEIMPCQPTLESWAVWLSKPDPDWREDVAQNGETFQASTMIRHADSIARLVDGELVLTPTPPASATFFAVAYPGGGWDVETASESARTTLGLDNDDQGFRYLNDSDDEERLAVCTDVPGYVTLRYEITAGEPRLILVEGPN